MEKYRILFYIFYFYSILASVNLELRAFSVVPQCAVKCKLMFCLSVLLFHMCVTVQLMTGTVYNYSDVCYIAASWRKCFGVCLGVLCIIRWPEVNRF